MGERGVGGEKTETTTGMELGKIRKSGDKNWLMDTILTEPLVGVGEPIPDSLVGELLSVRSVVVIYIVVVVILVVVCVIGVIDIRSLFS